MNDDDVTELRYLTDDRDLPEKKQNELVITPGGNGDWYVAIVPKGQGCMGKGMRICTSGGASVNAPGLGQGIAQAYRALARVKKDMEKARGTEHKTRSIWEEDECTTHAQDHEHLGDAYKRIFGEELVYKDAVNEENCGDGTNYVMPNGAIVWASFPGGSMISVSVEYDDTKAYTIAWRRDRLAETTEGGKSLLQKIWGSEWRCSSTSRYINVRKDKKKGRILQATTFTVRKRGVFGKVGDTIEEYPSTFKMIAAGWELD